MTIALLGRGGEGWLDAVVERCRHPARRLDLLAPLRGGAVRLDGRRILWQGFDLAQAAAVLVERPVFAWPQPRVDPGTGTASPQAEREARALLLSALHAAAEAVPVLDPPRAADLAVSPLLALDRCAAAGLDVHPWELVPQRPDDPGRTWIDPLGADLWTVPVAPAPGEPAFAPQPFPGGVLSVLVVGERVVGGRRHASADGWACRGTGAVLRGDSLDPDARERALEARRALGLSWLQVDLVEDGGAAAILAATAGADPAPWDRALPGEVATAFAGLLDRVAGGGR